MNIRRTLKIGGVIAGAMLIAFGAVSLFLSIDARNTVGTELKAEVITGADDMNPADIRASAAEAGLSTSVALPTCDVAGKLVDTGAEARCFAQYMSPGKCLSVVPWAPLFAMMLLITGGGFAVTGFIGFYQSMSISVNASRASPCSPDRPARRNTGLSKGSTSWACCFTAMKRTRCGLARACRMPRRAIWHLIKTPPGYR